MQLLWDALDYWCIENFLKTVKRIDILVNCAGCSARRRSTR